MINNIEYNNFRGRNGKLEFGPGVNIIRAKNEAGKSSVREGISFAWHGTDSAGGKNPDHLISQGEEACVFKLASPISTVTRRKKRGATSDVKIEVRGGPAVKLSQTELSGMLGLSFDTFTSCWQVGYFMKLASAKKIAVLGELANLNRHEILRGILPTHIKIPEQLKLINTKIDADKIADFRRQEQNTVANHEGALEQLRSQIAMLNQSEDVDVESYQILLNDINVRLENYAQYNRDVNKFNSDMKVYEMLYQAAATAKVDIDNLTKAVQAGLVKIKDLGFDFTLKAELAAKARVEINNLKTNFKEKPAPPRAPALPGEELCNSCGQVVSAEYRAKVVAEYKAALVAFNKADREVADYNKEVQDAINTAIVIEKDYTTSSQNLKTELAVEQAENKNRQEKLAKLQQMQPLPPKPLPPQKPEDDEADLNNQKTDAAAAIKVTQEKHSQLAKLLSDEHLYTQTIAVKKQNIVDYGVLEEAVRKIPQIETERTLEAIKIPNCSVALLDGEIVLTNETNVPYESMSDGRKIKTDLAICQSLRAAAEKVGKRPPTWIFMDNADLVDDYLSLLPKGVQVLIAKVDPGQNEVVVDKM